MGDDLTVPSKQPKERLRLDLADIRSQPLLEVTSVIGSRHKSEYKQVAVGGNYLFLLTSENRVLRQRFSVVHGSVSLDVERDDLTPATPHNEFLNAIFACRHTGDCLVVSKEEDTLYASATGSNCSLLHKLHGLHVISALWLDYQGPKRLIALGTKQGNVLEISLTDSNPRDQQVLRLLDLEPAAPVTNLAYEAFSAVPTLGCVFMATCYGIYFLTGPSTTEETRSLSGILQKYKSNPTALRNALSVAPSPGETSHMQLYRQLNGSAESFVFLSGSVLMFSCVPAEPETEGSCIVEIRSLPLPGYMKTPPQGCSISAQYLYLLYEDRLLVFSRFTLQLVSSVLLSFTGCYYRGLLYDPILNSILVWSNQVFTVQLEGEMRLHWTLLMEQGKFEEALEACRKHAQGYLPKANGLYADALVDAGDLEKAVDFYLDSDKQLEDVVFVLGAGRLAPLKRYLEACYDRLQADKVLEKHVLAHMLLNLLLVAKASQADIQVLFRKCSSSLDFGTTTQALQKFARIKELVLFCKETQAHYFLFRHYMNGLDYMQALDTLPRCRTEEIASALAETALIFVQIATTMFYRTLLRLFHDHSELTLLPLIPAIRATPETHVSTAAAFLQECMDASKHQEVHNCYLYHLTQLRDLRNIETYLTKQTASYQQTLSFDFDPEFAVALFRERQLAGPLVRLLAHLFRFKEAVESALLCEEVSLAEQTASQPLALARQLNAEMQNVTILSHSKVKELAYLFPPDVLEEFKSHVPQRKDVKRVEEMFSGLSKALWLQIAAWYGKKDDSQAVLQLLEKCPLVTFPDVAPFLSPSLPFNSIRDYVKATLTQFTSDIQEYKEHTAKCRQEAEQIKRERQRKENECIQGDVTQPCALCGRAMCRENAFLFPCLHAFHQSCLEKFYEDVDTGLGNRVKRTVMRLKEAPADKKADIERSLVDILSTECCFCSEAYINTLYQSLVPETLEQQQAWELSPGSSNREW